MWRFDCRVKLAACLRVLADKSLAPRPKFDRCATRHKLVSPLTPFPLTVLVRWIGCLRTPPLPFSPNCGNGLTTLILCSPLLPAHAPTEWAALFVGGVVAFSMLALLAYLLIHFSADLYGNSFAL